jgi:hypothetical protein
MLTEDYLMRILRLATAALARAVGLKAVELYQDALWVLDQAIEQLLGLRIDLFNRLDDTSVLASLTRDGELDLDRLNMAAELVHEQADVYRKMSMPEESRWRYARALTFYLEAALRGGMENFPLADERIASLVQDTSIDQLPAETVFSLYAYYESRGEFNPAEACLLLLKKEFVGNDDLQGELVSYYRRWWDKSDHELQQAGVTRQDLRTRMGSNGD